MILRPFYFLFFTIRIPRRLLVVSRVESAARMNGVVKNNPELGRRVTLTNGGMPGFSIFYLSHNIGFVTDKNICTQNLAAIL